MNGGAKLGRGPKAVTCYICGRGYGTTSIGIHVKQCQKLFLAQEAKKPKHERRPLPQPPKGVDVTEEDILNVRPGQANDVNWEKFNDAAFDTFNKEALVACENCGRTFLPDSLAHHRNACSSDRPTRRVGESVRADGGAAVPVSSPAAGGKSSAGSSAKTRPRSAAKKAERRPNTASRAGASLALGGGTQPQQHAKDDLHLHESFGQPQQRERPRETEDERAGDAHLASKTHASGLAILKSVVEDLKARNVPKALILECVREALE